MSDDKDRREQPKPTVRNPRYAGATPAHVALTLLRAKTNAPKKDGDEKRGSGD